MFDYQHWRVSVIIDMRGILSCISFSISIYRSVPGWMDLGSTPDNIFSSVLIYNVYTTLPLTGSQNLQYPVSYVQPVVYQIFWEIARVRGSYQSASEEPDPLEKTHSLGAW